jgi:hypothetical protein
MRAAPNSVICENPGHKQRNQFGNAMWLLYAAIEYVLVADRQKCGKTSTGRLPSGEGLGREGRMGFSFRVVPGVLIRPSSLAGESVQVSGCGRSAFISALTGRAYLPAWDQFRSAIQLTEAVIGGAEPARISMAAPGRQSKQAVRSRQARELAEAFEAIASVHCAGFPVATAGVGPAPAPTDQAAMRRRCKQEALRGVGVLQRAAPAEIGARIAEGEEHVTATGVGLISNHSARWSTTSHRD